MARTLTDPAGGLDTGRALPRRGDYNHQPVVGAYRVDVEEAFRHRSYFGLSLKATLFYGTFRDADGVAYSALRKLGLDWSAPLAVQTTRGGGQFAMHPSPGAFSGWPVRELVEGGQHHYEAGGGEGGFRFVHGPDRSEWAETDLLELAGGLVGGCGLQWYDPTPPGAFYISEQYRASGTIDGTPVEGFYCFDQLYFGPGVIWFESPYFTAPPYLEIAWHTFGTEYDDGTREVGHVFHGGQRLGFALIAGDDGPTVLSRDLAAEVELHGDGYPSRISYSIDGQPWEWVADPCGAMPDFSKGYPTDAYRPAEGLFRRVGERRRPVVWWSFLDTWADGRIPSPTRPLAGTPGPER